MNVNTWAGTGAVFMAIVTLFTSDLDFSTWWLALAAVNYIVAQDS